MKKMITRMFMIVAGLFLLATATSAQNNANQKSDKIIFLNGTTKEGKVHAFVDEKIRFTHTGETLSYEFPKKEIEKIEYSSGRTEMITERKIIEIPTLTVASKRRVAVIPMQYMGNSTGSTKEDMGFYLQEIVISYLSRSATELKFLDATEVNAVLLKNGISDSSIRKYTPGELAAILKAEYVIMGAVLQDKGKQVIQANGNKIRRQTWDDGDLRQRENQHQTIVASQMIETQVSLSIYNETGEKIYSKSRQSILSEQDAYKNAIHYLLKRTPLYKR